MSEYDARVAGFRSSNFMQSASSPWDPSAMPERGATGTSACLRRSTSRNSPQNGRAPVSAWIQHHARPRTSHWAPRGRACCLLRRHVVRSAGANVTAVSSPSSRTRPKSRMTRRPEDVTNTFSTASDLGATDGARAKRGYRRPAASAIRGESMIVRLRARGPRKPRKSTPSTSSILNIH